MEIKDNGSDMVEIEVEIPYWLDVAAQKSNVDMSAVLIEALKKELKLSGGMQE